MTILRLERVELSCFLDKLSGFISFDKDLPMNVFVGRDFSYWFFERPLLCFSDIFAGLISESVSSFNSYVFVKFSGGEPLTESCFVFDGSDVDRDVSWLSKKSENFFNGVVGYPIVLCNDACDWVAFESAYEEFGVIAIRSTGLKTGFYEYLSLNFISMDELSELAAGSSVEGVVAGRLISSYGTSA
ncbi:hypothetical protein FBY06_1591 [Pseudomonas sp. SJZ085]|nr:hypothetical protein FBX99_1591 [Pseudomonas sp. SJZ074]TWC29007.1 hypothetical protein FBY06_1591 [Pseudomonas sp. SJZ085]